MSNYNDKGLEDKLNNELHQGGYLLILFIVCLLLFIYLVSGAFIEHRKVNYIHQTSIGIILGVIVGIIIQFFALSGKDEKAYVEKFTFSGGFFFSFLLPPIIFAGGYNLQRSFFFKNISYINLFGVIGTILNFFIVAIGTYLMNEFNMIISIYDSSDKFQGSMIGKNIKLTITEVLLYSATICSTDAIAALSIINKDKYPKVFSILFGEGLVNDSVSIIIYVSVQNILSDSSSLELGPIDGLKIIVNFAINVLCSVTAGIVAALACTALLKYFRAVYKSKNNSVIENAIIFLSGFFAYTFCEIFKFSGVIAMLVAGIAMQHYIFYNISGQGKISTGITFETIGFLCEAFIYVYIGLAAVVVFSFYQISLIFIILQVVLMSIARFFAIFVVSFFVKLCAKDKFKLDVYELAIIWFSGLIRGSIAFALIQSLPNPEKDSAQVIKSTTLIIVMGTTIALSSLMPNYLSWAFSKIKTENESESEMDSQPGCIETIDNKYIKPITTYNYAQRQQEIQLTDQVFDKEQNHKVFNADELQKKLSRISQIAH